MQGRFSKIIKIIFLLSCCSSWAATSRQTSALSKLAQKQIVVVIPSYNTEKWCHNTLQTVISQNYENYRVVFIDDSSQDDTLNCATSFLKSKNIPFESIMFNDSGLSIMEATKLFKHRMLKAKNHKWIIIHNQNRCLSLENIYRTILSCPDDAIIALLDGDDWLAYNRVFHDINKIYSKKDVWLTYGSFLEYPVVQVGSDWAWTTAIPKNIIQHNLFRACPIPSAMRTFYAALFKKINIDDLLYKGKFFPVGWDAAIMFPMIEMAGNRHYFMRKVNYIYNTANEINDFKINPALQRDVDQIIRKKPRYKKISSLQPNH